MKQEQNKNQVEKRSFTGEIRMAAGEEGKKSRKVEGYAALFGTRANLGWFEEEIMEGALDGVLEASDVRALLNHDPNKLFARSTSGTLNLSIDKRGLKYSFEAPNTRDGDDLLVMLERGDLSQSSFAFSVKTADWIQEERDGETVEVRKITKIDRLFDVSPVTYPAYEDTTVAKRSFMETQRDKKEVVAPLEAVKELLEEKEKDKNYKEEIAHFRLLASL